MLKGSPSLALPDRPDLGELQEYYSAFRKSCIDYSNNVSIDMYGKKIAAMQEEIRNIDRYINRLSASEKLFSERFELESKKYRRDSILYVQEVYSLTAFEKSRQDWLQSGIDLERIRLDRASRAIERSSKQQEIEDLLARGEEERERFRSVMETDYLNLTARLDWWFQNYLLVSPIDGRVTFNKFWGTNQVVEEGETVLTVVPEGEMEIVARVKLSVKGSGKVEQGQQVNIKLNGYPYLEYGMVQGIVSSKSLAATADGYIVDVELPDNLTTFYGQ
ncbi:MAG: HlyD family efflux transporter periplasmic adaptor subunit [Bacteroidales bacterium]